MSEKIFKILLEEFKRNGVKLIGHDFRCDVFISDPADIIHETFERQCTTIPQLLDFSAHDKVFEDKIARLEENVGYYKDSLSRVEKNCDKLYHENKELKQRISELESKETENCEKEPKISDSAPSIDWYENRHQADCIEINRLNTTIDVLIHKIEYLRQFAGLE